MSTNAASNPEPNSLFQQLRYGREILRLEAEALAQLAGRLDRSFCQAADLLHGCLGSVIVCGIGKAGLVGQKVAATLASTGTRSHFLHPAEAIHGDLGRIHSDDVILILSYSGQTAEIVNLLPAFESLGASIVAVTGSCDSQLARSAHVVLDLGDLTEACSMGLAPSTSTTAMLALGDALALVVSQMRGFTANDFARFHPGGSLGRQLTRVKDVMRPLEHCRVARDSQTVREVLIQVGRPGRRTGAVMLTGTDGKVSGIFTDSDLARLLESKNDTAIDEAIGNVMTSDPETIRHDAMLSVAVGILARRKISELPVVDSDQNPCGLIDITDVLGLIPYQEPAPAAVSKPTKSADTKTIHGVVVPFPNPVVHSQRSKP